MMNLHQQFQQKLENQKNESKTVSLYEEFTKNLNLLNEEGGSERGRGPIPSGGAVKKGFKDALKSVSFDYLNKSNVLGQKEATFNVRNYYALDLRLKTPDLIRGWEAGEQTYSRVFDGIYHGSNLAQNMKDKLQSMYWTW